MADSKIIVELSKRLQVLSFEQEKVQAEIEAVMAELSQQFGGQTTALRQIRAPITEAQTQKAAPRMPAKDMMGKPEIAPGMKRRPKEGHEQTIPGRLIALFDENPTRDFAPKEIFEAIDIPSNKKTQVYLALSRLKKEGRIGKTADGYCSVNAHPPTVRKGAHANGAVASA